jgi:hypothetical protein
MELEKMFWTGPVQQPQTPVLYILSLAGQIVILVPEISAGRNRQLVGSWGRLMSGQPLLPPKFWSSLFVKSIIFADKRTTQIPASCSELEIKVWEVTNA